jgi:hypothetical protein
MARRDWLGLLAVALVLAAMAIYRQAYVEPRAWGAICAAEQPPFACVPRAALLWLQRFGLWGGGATGLGLWAFMGGPFAVRVAAAALGACAVLNYNASWGMLGAALGAWSWLSPPRGRLPTGGEHAA